MKIAIDRNYTTINSLKLVQEAVKEFKARYTDTDVLNAINDEYGFFVNGEVIKLKIDAWCNLTGSDGLKGVTFTVRRMVVDSLYQFDVIQSVYFNLEFEFSDVVKPTHRTYSLDPSDDD